MGRVELDHPHKIPMFLYHSQVAEHEKPESNITSTMELNFFGNEHLVCNKNDRPTFTYSAHSPHHFPRLPCLDALNERMDDAAALLQAAPAAIMQHWRVWEAWKWPCTFDVCTLFWAFWTPFNLVTHLNYCIISAFRIYPCERHVYMAPNIIRPLPQQPPAGRRCMLVVHAAVAADGARAWIT